MLKTALILIQDTIFIHLVKLLNVKLAAPSARLKINVIRVFKGITWVIVISVLAFHVIMDAQCVAWLIVKKSAMYARVGFI